MVLSELNSQFVILQYGEIKDFFPEVIGYYFDLLIENCPEVEGYFENIEIENHFKMISLTMSFIVENIENRGKVATNLIHLGKKISGWEIKKEHYVLFLESFLLTLEHFYLAHWNENIRGEWKKLIVFVMSCLVKGMKA